MSHLLAMTLAGALVRSAAAEPAPPPPPPPAPDVEPAEPDADEPLVEIEPEPDEPEPEPTPEPIAESPAQEPDVSPDNKPDAQVDNDDAKADDDDDDDDDKASKNPFKTKYLTIGGYLQPQYSYRVRRNARPRDQREFGAGQTRGGLIFEGRVLDRWSYKTHFVVGSNVTNVVTDIDVVDPDGDGTIEGINFRRELVPGLSIEELWVNFRPLEVDSKGGMEIVAIDIRLGQVRVPFSSQNRTQNNSLLFPRRSQPVQAFLVGSDLGAEVAFDFADERVELSGAVFNGTGFSVERRNRRGPLYLGRFDVSPLGKLPDCECDIERSKFKFSLGTGLLYSPFKLFDNAGNDTLTRARDLLVSASARVVVKGFFFQGEFLRRQLTDNLTSRPFLNTGAHGQLTYYIPVIKTLGMGPVGNFGWTATEESVRPIQRYFTQDGIAFYLSNDVMLDAVRVLLLYEGEWRTTEQERAHGGTVQVQVKF